jgi:lipid-A-disaccharide synthase-like uncharacterized protein
MNWNGWHLLGISAQIIFGSRFLVQWLVSERRGTSVIPPYFWYASLVGSVALLVYSIHIKDPVFILGQSFGLVVYSRNLMLRRQPRP